MALFTVELNRLSNSIGESDLTIYAHTQAPNDANPARGRTTRGGSAYENGTTLRANDISDAASGDITNTAIVDFGTADENVGVIVGVSGYRGAQPVGYWAVPATRVDSGDRFQVNVGGLDINGSST